MLGMSQHGKRVAQDDQTYVIPKTMGTVRDVAPVGFAHAAELSPSVQVLDDPEDVEVGSCRGMRDAGSLMTRPVGCAKSIGEKMTGRRRTPLACLATSTAS
jgi:hypothetical protein